MTLSTGLNFSMIIFCSLPLSIFESIALSTFYYLCIIYVAMALSTSRYLSMVIFVVWLTSLTKSCIYNLLDIIFCSLPLSINRKIWMTVLLVIHLWQPPWRTRLTFGWPLYTTWITWTWALKSPVGYWNIISNSRRFLSGNFVPLPFEWSLFRTRLNSDWTRCIFHMAHPRYRDVQAM